VLGPRGSRRLGPAQLQKGNPASFRRAPRGMPRLREETDTDPLRTTGSRLTRQHTLVQQPESSLTSACDNQWLAED